MGKSNKTLLTYGAIGLLTAAPLVPTTLAFAVAAFAGLRLEHKQIAALHGLGARHKRCFGNGAFFGLSFDFHPSPSAVLPW